MPHSEITHLQICMGTSLLIGAAAEDDFEYGGEENCMSEIPEHVATSFVMFTCYVHLYASLIMLLVGC